MLYHQEYSSTKNLILDEWIVDSALYTESNTIIPILMHVKQTNIPIIL